ncbi:MAG: sugar ABC transporter permease [Clostridia bacterium]|nr:sugar ABC transporter permease [Clostridia bacterium]
MEFIRKEKKKKGNWRNTLFFWCLIGPALLQFVVMYLFVNFNSLIMSVRAYDIESNTWYFYGFKNFESLFYDFSHLPELRYGIQNSFIAWSVSLVITLPLGLLFAYYIAKKFFGAGVFRVLLFLPQIISANILVIIFKYYADAFLPTVINDLFGTKLFGFLSQKDSQFPAILIFNIYIGFGTSVLMYTGAMNGISKSVLEAAELDGTNTLQEFILIVLPQIIGTVSVFVITGVTALFTNQLNLYSIYHKNADSHLYTVGYYMYREIQSASSYASYPKMAALGIMITLVVAPLIICMRRLSKKLNPLED